MKKVFFSVLLLVISARAETIPVELARDLALKNWEMTAKCNGWGQTHEIQTKMDMRNGKFVTDVKYFEIIDGKRYNITYYIVMSRIKGLLSR